MTPTSRDEFRKFYNELKDGWIDIYCDELERTPSRYKYYWDCVMRLMLTGAGDKFQILGGDGVIRPAKSTEEIHAFMKFKYNSIEIVDPETGQMFRIPNTTTGMTDSKFIQEYEHVIIADHSGPPFNLEFPTRQQYADMRRPVP